MSIAVDNKINSFNKVAVIGGGTIGSSWAALFLAKGLSVSLVDPDPGSEARARTLITNVWPDLLSLGLATAPINWSLFEFGSNLEQAVANADFVQENGPELEDFKISLFAQMDAVAPENTILASSSSGLLMSKIQSKCQRPQRCVIGHPFNPPHLIPLVEVVGGAKTSMVFIDTAMDFYKWLGKSPIKINKEVTGHIANRLQGAVWREAIYLAQQGVASLEDIDKAISEGPGLRWSVFGPSMTFNLGGGSGGMAHFLDHLQEPVKSWWASLGDVDLNEETRALLLEGLEKASAGRSIDELVKHRDQTLLRILAAKYQ